jgi:hypothetical protein
VTPPCVLLLAAFSENRSSPPLSVSLPVIGLNPDIKISRSCLILHRFASVKPKRATDWVSLNLPTTTHFTLTGFEKTSRLENMPMLFAAQGNGNTYKKLYVMYHDSSLAGCQLVGFFFSIDCQRCYRYVYSA